jgi:predicted Zn-dependent protease with MMP-like domain
LRAVIVVEEEQFIVLVGDALDQVPEALAGLIDNVVVVVEDRHPDEDLLGLYDGVPLTERDDYGGLVMPDRITVYRMAICEMCDTLDEVVEEVLVTVVHELAHHFGIDDDELHRLGWD